METVVIFKSKYGSTKKYAEWIAEELNCGIFESDKVDKRIFSKYDTVIYGGGLYVGGILGFSFIKKNYKLLKDKRLIVFGVGATSKGVDAEKEIENKNITEEMKKNTKFFLLRGALDYKSMGYMDKFLMFMLLKSIKRKKPEELDNDSKGIIATYGKKVDFTDIKYIKPIVEAAKRSAK